LIEQTVLTIWANGGPGELSQLLDAGDVLDFQIRMSEDKVRETSVGEILTGEVWTEETDFRGNTWCKLLAVFTCLLLGLFLLTFW
jgi:hypothetical protein